MSKWTAHVKKTMKQMKAKGDYKKGDGLMAVLKEAKKTYKKHGGADDEEKVAAPVIDVPEPVVAGRRKRGGKTRRHRK